MMRDPGNSSAASGVGGGEASGLSDLPYEDRAYAIEADHPWEANGDGLWCINCGNHIAAPWNIKDGYEPPPSCRDCGFPEFGQ